jgi:hypothetical protein
MSVSESTLTEQDKSRIEAVCDRREIEHLVHFTQLSNLETILEKKTLLPVEQLERSEVEINDTSRYDNHLDALSLSVEFPNYSMFYKYQQEKDDVCWVVLTLDCSILWELDCAFYYENAASGTFRNVPPSNFKSAESFERMFNDIEYKGVTVLRENLDIPNRFTTNPQAEILVFSDIPIGYIKEVVCESIDEKRVLENEIKKLSVNRKRSFFKYRNDYEIWKTISDTDKGDSKAKQKLGYHLVQGQKLRQDIDTAANLFLEAARAGVTVAQFNIGLCYETGHGVEENLEKARSWYQRSAENGFQSAEDKLSELEDSNSEPDDDLPF